MSQVWVGQAPAATRAIAPYEALAAHTLSANKDMKACPRRRPVMRRPFHKNMLQCLCNCCAVKIVMPNQDLLTLHARRWHHHSFDQANIKKKTLPVSKLALAPCKARAARVRTQANQPHVKVKAGRCWSGRFHDHKMLCVRCVNQHTKRK